MAVAVEARRTAIQRAHRILLAVLGALFLVLVLTGLWLTFRYQPSGSFAGAHAQSWVRITHRAIARAFVATALGVFALSIAVSYERALRRGMPAWVLGLVTVVAALATSLSGYLLPWDQLALAPLRPGQYRGYAFLFGHGEVRFALIGTVEVGKDTVRNWFFAHTVAFPVALVALGVLGWRLTRRDRVSRD